ncbi:hypothetical protein D3C80_1190610 [compost metagenome]
MTHVLLLEANGLALGLLHPRVGGHHQDHVAKIGLAPVVVRQGAVVHDLQQQVEDIRVRLLDLVQQHHRMGMLEHRIGQQAALLEAHIAGRCPNQAGNGMALHVFGHIKAQHLDPERLAELLGDFGLAHPGRAGKQEAAHRATLVAKAGA